jgi:RNA polymerase sigma factor (sigma-70 family)
MAATPLGTFLHNLRRSLLRQDTVGFTDGELLERFVARVDETSFEALLHRHGPMVLGVCRRVLQNEADAEDAFQTTFLVLVRKASSIRPRDMVGNWLYGVAHSTALKARAMRTKRWAKEREAAARSKPEVAAETWQHLQTLLDQELQTLPNHYRVAIILCDLEGKSLKEAAQQLGCPSGTIGTRLSRGRAMLARRLTRQGVALSPAALAIVLSQNAASASLPATLAISTTKAAALLAAGTAPAGMISAHVATLTNAVLKTMLLTKLKIATAILVLVPLVVVGAGVSYSTKAAEQTDLGKTAEKADRPKSDEDKMPGPQEIDFTTAVAEVPKDLKAKGAKELPPGLANKSVNHPGRVAWLKTHNP